MNHKSKFKDTILNPFSKCPMLLLTLSVMAMSTTSCRRPGASKGIVLEWKGVDEKLDLSANLLTLLKKKSIHLENFTDSRKDTKIVGKYDSGESVPAKNDVLQFCTTVVSDQFKNVGVNFMERGAEYTLQGELLEFFVLEDGVYNGKVQVKFSLLRRNTPIWEATYTGESKRWGRSHSAENYNEALSNSLDSTLKKLVADREFEAALESNKGAAPIIVNSEPDKNQKKKPKKLKPKN